MTLRWLFVFCCLLSACSPGTTPQQPKEKEILYVGTFSVRGSEGVYAFEFDRVSRNFQLIETVSGPDSPSFLDVSPDGGYLYTANREGIRPDSLNGSVSAYRIDPNTGQLQLLNQSSSFGASPCHIHTDGERLYLSHYAGGSISVLSLAEDGSIGSLLDTIQHTGAGPHPTRQEGPHLHSILSLPASGLFLAADLGTDQLAFYQAEATDVKKAAIPPIRTEGGAGPRHFTFSADHDYVYVAEELSSTVSVHRLQLGEQTTSSLQRVSTLPETFSTQNTVADIHLSPDGRFLYVSNRGHDSLAIFAVDAETGQLSLVGHQSVLGKTPRNFLVDPKGEFILVANQDTDEIILFDRDPTSGLLESTDIRISLPSPVCLRLINL